MTQILNRGDYRITVTTLAYGQPRPYADHTYTHRVYFEQVPCFLDTPIEYQPCEWSKEVIMPYLKAIRFWLPDDKRDFTAPRLKSLMNLKPGLWEFTVVEAYTD